MQQDEDAARPELERIEREIRESAQTAGRALPDLLKASRALAAMLKEIPPSPPPGRRLSKAHVAVIGDALHTLAEAGKAQDNKTQASKELVRKILRWCTDLSVLINPPSF